MILVLAMTAGVVPAQVLAAGKQVNYLPEIPIGQDILGHDVFYLASDSASVPEDGDGVYLLRVGRGGAAMLTRLEAVRA